MLIAPAPGKTEILDTQTLAAVKSMRASWNKSGLAVLELLENPEHSAEIQQKHALGFFKISRHDAEVSPLRFENIFPAMEDSALKHVIDQKVTDYLHCEKIRSEAIINALSARQKSANSMAAASQQARAKFSQSSATLEDAIENAKQYFPNIDELAKEAMTPLNIKMIKTGHGEALYGQDLPEALKRLSAINYGLNNVDAIVMHANLERGKASARVPEDMQQDLTAIKEALRYASGNEGDYFMVEKPIEKQAAAEVSANL